MTLQSAFFWLAALTSISLAAPSAGDPTVVEKMRGLVAFWTFSEEAGQPRLSPVTKEQHLLAEVGGPIERAEGGSFSGYAAEFSGRQYFRIPHLESGDLNIGGKDAQVSMFAVVRLEDLTRRTTIAGIWSEGKGANDDTGTRQYAMLLKHADLRRDAATDAAYFQ